MSAPVSIWNTIYTEANSLTRTLINILENLYWWKANQGAINFATRSRRVFLGVFETQIQFKRQKVQNLHISNPMPLTKWTYLN